MLLCICVRVASWLHSLKVAQLLRSAACLHTNQSRSYLNHLLHTIYPLHNAPGTWWGRTTPLFTPQTRYLQEVTSILGPGRTVTFHYFWSLNNLFTVTTHSAGTVIMHSHRSYGTIAANLLLVCPTMGWPM